MEEFWSKYGFSLLIIFATGICGGMVNCLMVEDGFTSPRVFTSKKGIKTWNPGFLKNVLFGIVASFLAWSLGANELSIVKQAGFCLLAGISGSTVILSFLQKQRLDVEKTKASEYRKMVLDELAEQEEDDEQEVPGS